MKTYKVNYINLKTGSSSTIKVSAENIKQANQIAQRQKTDKNAVTSVFIERN